MRSHARGGRRALAVAIAAAGAWAPSAALAADPVMPLADVRVGMTGTAYTVVSGTDIVTFPVTVLDVVRAGDGPGSSLIVIRAEGPLMDQTGGIAQGMSGSPVYVTGADGVPRVIGAIAYGQGDEKNVIGGITPIEQMLAMTRGKAQLSVVRRPATRAYVAADRAGARRLRRAHPGARVFAPLMRWSASGISPRLVPALRRALGPGVQVDATAPGGVRPRVDLRPGASLAAALISGPVTLGAVGTVTYTDGPVVLGFGHPFLDNGPSHLLLSDAHITTVVAAPIKGESYKLGALGNVQGTIVGDRHDGVMGRVGPAPAVTISSFARDEGRGTQSSMTNQVAPQPELLPLAADLLQLEPLLRARDGSGRGTLSVRYTIHAPGMAPIRYRNVYAAEGDVTTLASGRLGAILSVLTDNPVRQVVPTSISIVQVIRPDVRAGTIVAARVPSPVVHRGRPARLVLTLKMWRAGTKRVVVPFRVPRDLTPGRVALRVVPNSIDGFDATPADLASTLNGESAPLTVARPGRAPVATAVRPGQRVARLVKAATADQHDAVRILGPGQDPDRRQGLVAGTRGVVIAGGRAVVRVTVR